MNRLSITKHVRRGKSRGVALIYVIAVSGLVALLIGLMINQYVMRSRSLHTSLKRTQVFYTAESGIRKTFWFLTEDSDKGIQWRTGNLLEDSPVREKVFFDRDDEVELSVIDDCGFLRIRSRTLGTPRRTIELRAAASIPKEMKSTLCVISEKPLIFGTGSHVRGTVQLNQDPLYQGGSLDGILETNGTLSLPPLLNATFKNAIAYFRYLLSTPLWHLTELHNPQVFSPDRPLPSAKLFVNDAVLVENTHLDSLWTAGTDVHLTATADVQVSGNTRLYRTTIAAIGAVRILDNAEFISSRIFSETAIELAGNAQVSGVLIAPVIVLEDKSQLLYPSVIYCGAPLTSGVVAFHTNTTIGCTTINLCTNEHSGTEISNQIRIEGLVFSLAPVTLKGTVCGHLYCRGFRDTPVTQDTSNTNIISGIIEPADSLTPLTIPVVFQTVNDFKVIEWQEY